MIRRQIQLEEKQYHQLRVLGAREDKGLAQQVREAVSLYLAGRRSRPLPSLDDISGKFHKLPPSAIEELKPHDQWLAAAIEHSKQK